MVEDSGSAVDQVPPRIIKKRDWPRKVVIYFWSSLVAGALVGSGVSLIFTPGTTLKTVPIFMIFQNPLAVPLIILVFIVLILLSFIVWGFGRPRQSPLSEPSGEDPPDFTDVTIDIPRDGERVPRYMECEGKLPGRVRRLQFWLVVVPLTNPEAHIIQGQVSPAAFDQWVGLVCLARRPSKITDHHFRIWLVWTTGRASLVFKDAAGKYPIKDLPEGHAIVRRVTVIGEEATSNSSNHSHT